MVCSEGVWYARERLTIVTRPRGSVLRSYGGTVRGKHCLTPSETLLLLRRSLLTLIGLNGVSITASQLSSEVSQNCVCVLEDVRFAASESSIAREIQTHLWNGRDMPPEVLCEANAEIERNRERMAAKQTEKRKKMAKKPAKLLEQQKASNESSASVLPCKRSRPDSEEAPFETNELCARLRDIFPESHVVLTYDESASFKRSKPPVPRAAAIVLEEDIPSCDALQRALTLLPSSTQLHLAFVANGEVVRQRVELFRH
ncbi:MAG: hypothetical protein MHM6MM_000271 [Cercozoa sp. M6MM]